MSQPSLGSANPDGTGEEQTREAARLAELAVHNPEGVRAWKGIVSEAMRSKRVCDPSKSELAQLTLMDTWKWSHPSALSRTIMKSKLDGFMDWEPNIKKDPGLEVLLTHVLEDLQIVLDSKRRANTDDTVPGKKPKGWFLRCKSL